MSTSASVSRQLLGRFLERNPKVEARIASGIETNRKSDARLRFVDARGRPVTGVRVSVRQVRHDFLFGANIFPLGSFADERMNRLYEQAFLQAFNSAVVPFYWSDLEPERGKPRFDRDSPRIARRPPPDLVLNFCERHGITAKGHCLVWHQWLPSWIPSDPSEAAVLMRGRIAQIAARYGRRVACWDVVNEPMEKFMFPAVTMLPDDYIETSLREAGRAFPAQASLFVNEATAYSWREFHEQTTGYHLLIENLRLKGARVDGIGLQYHLFFYDENGLTRTVQDLVKNRDVYLDPARLLSVLDLYAKHGLPVHISEITLPCYPDLDDAEQFQADLLRELYRLWFSHPAVEGIYWWNLNDGGAHGPEGKLHGGLLRADLSPKPAYETLRRLIHEEWTTRFETEAGAECSFRGFHGDYEIIVEHAGRRSTHAIGLHRGVANEFRLVVAPAAGEPEPITAGGGEWRQPAPLPDEARPRS